MYVPLAVTVPGSKYDKNSRGGSVDIDNDGY